MTGAHFPRLAWQDGDIVMVSITALVAVIGIVGAWFGATGAGSMAAQAGWLNLGVASLAVYAVGVCLWLLRGRRAVGERRVALISLDIGEEPVPAGAGGGHGTRASPRLPAGGR